MADTRERDKPLGSPADFEEAFPGLQDAAIESRAGRPGDDFRTDRPLPTTRISLKVRGPIMHCLNPNCRDGEYDIGALVREMPRTGELEHTGRVTCAGKEAEPGKPWEECRDCSWAWVWDGNTHSYPNEVLEEPIIAYRLDSLWVQN